MYIEDKNVVQTLSFFEMSKLISALHINCYIRYNIF